MKKYLFKDSLPEEFYWLNEPEEYYFDQGLVIRTDPETDFWQRTHYGFQRDNGHALLTELNGDFSLAAHVEFYPEATYDQSGIFIRIDRDNWIKISTEYEDVNISRLGSVVTNLGYSDWASTDISSNISSMWYRVNRKGSDFLIENSLDGKTWSQMRITHFHQEKKGLEAGVYACSPADSSFECRIKELVIGDSSWD